MFKISKDIFFFKKRVLKQICGFFQHVLSLFETFTTLYNSCIKFDLFDWFLYILRSPSYFFFFENLLKGPLWLLCIVMWWAYCAPSPPVWYRFNWSTKNWVASVPPLAAGLICEDDMQEKRFHFKCTVVKCKDAFRCGWKLKSVTIQIMFNQPL